MFGSRFVPAIGALLILLPGAVAFAPASVLAVFFSMRIGRARYAFLLALGSTLTSAVVAVIMIPRFGIRGAAVASTLGYISSMAIAIGWFTRITHAPLGSFVPRAADLLVYRSAVLRLSGRV
jgi:O-antigen/teichoic acid export membrane protein